MAYESKVTDSVAKAKGLPQETLHAETTCVDRSRITIEVLNRINQGLPTADLLKEVVNLLVESTGFEAVGLRLKEADDYPYFQTRGMSEEFVLLENSLCPKKHKNQAEPDSKSNVPLECVCGSVIQGRIDRSESFFTAYGSFWSNSNTQLLAERPELQNSIRGNCVRVGYESSALIPLRIGNETFGLLQFEDKRPGLISEELLSSLESIAVSLALALSQRQYAEDLRREKEALESLNEDLRAFVSVASHDLQEPLRKVKTFGMMLQQKFSASLSEQGNGYLERILDANQRMQSLLTTLLEYSRLSTKADPFEEADLTNIVGEVLSDLEVRIETTRGEIHVGDLPVIQADPTQMRQLFQNLIGNALKFHKPGDKPMVQVRSVSNTDSECRITVDDNGIGFDEQYLEKIFAPFHRLHGRNEYEGTGMGLAICKKIVERHGGSIKAESEPGKGSAFIIRLPVKQDR
jgi:signal transduction histidine kinase